jgi:DMSO reductase anchor subunit
MPSAGHTLSTTRITLPKNSKVMLDRVDIETLRPEHPHWSLVWMTTLIQLSVGTLLVSVISGRANCIALTFILALTAFSLNISVLHLGRPAYAWRALKMWRRSWLSREVMLFGLFFVSLSSLTLASWLWAYPYPLAENHALGVLECAASGIGVAGLLASARIYLVPARPAWNTSHTPIDFVLSALLLGCSAVPTFTSWSNQVLRMSHLSVIPFAGETNVHWPFAVAAALWMTNQLVRVIRLGRSRSYERRASCSLLNTHNLRGTFLVSFAFVGLAALLMSAGLTCFVLPAAFAGVITSRYLFFVSVVPLNMALTFVRQVHA